MGGPIHPDRDLLTAGQGSRPTWASGSPTRPPATLPTTFASSSPTRRLLISGDHLLGRISLFFDYGYSPDPAGSSCNPLNMVGRARGAAAPGRSRAARSPTSQAHIRGNRQLVQERLDLVEGALQRGRTDGLRADSPRLRAGAGVRNADWLLSASYSSSSPTCRPRGSRPSDRGRAGALGRRCITGAAAAGRTAGRSPGRCMVRGMRIDQILGRREPVFSFEFFPPKTPAGGGSTSRRPWPSCEARAGVRVGHLRRRGSTRDRKTIEIVKQITGPLRPRGDGATSRAWPPPSRAARPRGDAAAGLENVPRPAGRPAARADAVDRHRGRPRLPRELVELISQRLPVRDRGGLLPRDPRPRHQRRGGPANTWPRRSTRGSTS